MYKTAVAGGGEERMNVNRRMTGSRVAQSHGEMGKEGKGGFQRRTRERSSMANDFRAVSAWQRSRSSLEANRKGKRGRGWREGGATGSIRTSREWESGSSIAVGRWAARPTHHISSKRRRTPRFDCRRGTAPLSEPASTARLEFLQDGFH